MAVGGEDEFFAIAGEHREAIEFGAEGDLFESGAIDVDDEEVEFSAHWVVVVAAENDLFAVRVDERGETGLLEIGNLAFVSSIGIHDPEVHSAWSDKVLFEEVLVGVDFFLVGEGG